jgi:hypothetical protein
VRLAVADLDVPGEAQRVAWLDSRLDSFLARRKIVAQVLGEVSTEHLFPGLDLGVGRKGGYYERASSRTRWRENGRAEGSGQTGGAAIEGLGESGEELRGGGSACKIGNSDVIATDPSAAPEHRRTERLAGGAPERGTACSPRFGVPPELSN